MLVFCVCDLWCFFNQLTLSQVPFWTYKPSQGLQCYDWFQPPTKNATVDQAYQLNKETHPTKWKAKTNPFAFCCTHQWIVDLKTWNNHVHRRSIHHKECHGVLVWIHDSQKYWGNGRSQGSLIFWFSERIPTARCQSCESLPAVEGKTVKHTSRKKDMETLNKPYYIVFNVYQHRSRASTIPYILILCSTFPAD